MSLKMLLLPVQLVNGFGGAQQRARANTGPCCAATKTSAVTMTMRQLVWRLWEGWSISYPQLG